MKTLILAVAMLGLSAGTPAAANPDTGPIKVDLRAVLAPDGYAVRQYSRDDGFFSHRGGGVDVRYGRAGFDYDRSYPFDYDALPEAPEIREPQLRERSCEDVPVRGARDGGDLVRICRD